MSTNPIAIFFHGLNTFCDDVLHLGPVNLGRMDRHVKSEFEARGVRVYSIDGIGTGSPEEQARIASDQIARTDAIELGSSLNLIGNSMGGLVTRALAHHWKNNPASNSKRLKIERLISWGTPHRGSIAAEFAVEFPNNNPRVSRVLTALGYKFGKHNDTYKHYSPKALADFNARYPVNFYGPEYYFECVAGLRDISPYFYFFFLRVAQPSDGFIPVSSQSWGQCAGRFNLDHFAQTGFNEILVSIAQRSRSRNEFKKLCDAMADLIKSPVELSNKVEKFAPIGPA